MANISTNQVKQLYVVAPTDTIDVKFTTVGNATTGDSAINVRKDTAFIEIKDANNNVKAKTDFIYLDNILYNKIVEASNDTLHRKAFHIELNSNVNGGAPVAGQDYIITLTYRGFYGEEATMHKTAEVHVIPGMTTAQFYGKMAESFFLNSTAPSGQKFFELYFLAEGAESATKIETLDDAQDVNAPFEVVEPIPYWSLGRFPETLEKMEITTSTILVDTDMVSDWLDDYKPYDAVTAELVSAIPNSHKLADLEYFCKGERGLSAPLHVSYRDRIDPKLEIDSNNATGYDIMTIHYAFIGHNASNQRSERDLVFVGVGAADKFESCLEQIAKRGEA